MHLERYRTNHGASGEVAARSSYQTATKSMLCCRRFSFLLSMAASTPFVSRPPESFGSLSPFFQAIEKNRPTRARVKKKQNKLTLRTRETAEKSESEREKRKKKTLHNPLPFFRLFFCLSPDLSHPPFFNQTFKNQVSDFLFFKYRVSSLVCVAFEWGRGRLESENISKGKASRSSQLDDGVFWGTLEIVEASFLCWVRRFPFPRFVSFLCRAASDTKSCVCTIRRRKEKWRLERRRLVFPSFFTTFEPAA